MRTIALIDPFWTGHHSSYLKLFSKTALSLGYRVMVFCPNPLVVNSWEIENVNNCRDRFHVYKSHAPDEFQCPVLRIEIALNGLLWWRFAARTIKKAHDETGFRPDLVFFPWLDSYMGRFRNHHVIDFVFPYNWTGLYFHPRHLRYPLLSPSSRGGYNDHDESLRSKRCKSVAVLDEGISGKLQDKLPGKPVVIFPDVADASRPEHDFPVLHEVISKSGGRKIITVIGGLAKRKGMLTLLQTALRSTSAKWFFLFAGLLSECSFDADELQFIRGIASDPPQNCYFHFDFIPEEARFNALVERSDILFASYEDFPHSSNILTKAALFEKPVIVSTGGCMEERVKTFRMGASIEYGNVSQCSDAIGWLTETKNLPADFAGYRYLHSEDRLNAAFQEVCNRYFL